MKTKAREALRGLKDGCGTQRGGSAGRRPGAPQSGDGGRGTGGPSCTPKASFFDTHVHTHMHTHIHAYTHTHAHPRVHTHTRIVVGGHTESGFSELISSSVLRHELWGPWRISVAGKDNRLLLMELQGLFLFLTVPSCHPALLFLSHPHLHNPSFPGASFSPEGTGRNALKNL